MTGAIIVYQNSDTMHTVLLTATNIGTYISMIIITIDSAMIIPIRGMEVIDRVPAFDIVTATANASVRVSFRVPL